MFLGPLAKKQLTKLKIYNGENHPHDIQKPKVVDFKKLNKEIWLKVNGKFKYFKHETKKIKT